MWSSPPEVRVGISSIESTAVAYPIYVMAKRAVTFDNKLAQSFPTFRIFVAWMHAGFVMKHH